MSRFNTIFEKSSNLFLKDQSLLIAVSGGQDSIALLFLIFQIKNFWDWKIGAIFCNHFWQIDSFYTTDYLIKLLYNLNLYFIETIPFWSILTENRGRRWRYQQFERLGNFFNYSSIVIAHTTTDQTETFFLNLFRGTGSRYPVDVKPKKIVLKSRKNRNFVKKRGVELIKGEKLFSKNQKISIPDDLVISFLPSFSSFPSFPARRSFLIKQKGGNPTKFDPPLSIVRPLLRFHRWEILQFIRINRLSTHPDKSNRKLKYWRNRLRKQLLPTIRFFFNRQVDRLFSQSIKIGLMEQDSFSFLIQSISSSITQISRTYDSTFYFVIDISIFPFLPLPLQQKLLKFFLENFSSFRINFLQINLLLSSTTLDSTQTLSFQLLPQNGVIGIKDRRILLLKSENS